MRIDEIWRRQGKDRFGDVADNIYLHFDSVEKSGQKHFIDLEFNNMLNIEEE